MARALPPWEDDTMRLPDGTVYALAGEDVLGRHGGRAWEVYVYEEEGRPPTRTLGVDSGWPTKRRARAVAERDARAKLYG